MTQIRLTPQQRAIVDHVDGPALVYAVAGAGKTTALVHRIAKLVQKQICAPHEILAATFNKAAQLDLARQIHALDGCQAVKPMTLHALGYRIIRQAKDAGELAWLQDEYAEIEVADRRILTQAKATARARNVNFRSELEQLADEDFLTYVGICKGSLAYADLDAASLPQAALKIARQAPPPLTNRWYLDLYKLFEQTRQSQGLLTFDDLLMTGWEVMVRYPDIRHYFQSKYRFVMIDEYQDLNLAQAEMLDILTAPHRNYMAIGDDDQTIYTWRGASADFMLEFEQRYSARRYYMTENFRCRAGHIALANAVITQKRRGLRKRLQLTRGFDGTAEVCAMPSERDMAADIVRRVQHAQQGSVRLDDMAVLVRIYAQTGPIEDALIAAGIPYSVVGSHPFYLRPEVQTLLDYWRLAMLNAGLRSGRTLEAAELVEFGRAWRQTYWRPTRYIPREVADAIEQTVTARQVSLAEAVEGVESRLNPRQNRALADFCSTLDWLARIAGPHAKPSLRAAQVLADLEQRLEYKDYLRSHSEFSGTEQADNVDAFVNYARNYATIHELDTHLSYLQQEAGATRSEGNEAVQISTIHRAKGKEWTVVFVPGCHDGILPSNRAVEETDVEEERRLLYVAITRAREMLTLYYFEQLEISPFLAEADYRKTLDKSNRLAALMRTHPDKWQVPRDAAALVAYAQEFGFGSYFADWWQVDEGRRQLVGCKAASFVLAAEDAPAGYPYRPTAEDRTLWRKLAGDAFSPLPMTLTLPQPPRQRPEPRPSPETQPPARTRPASAAHQTKRAQPQRSDRAHQQKRPSRPQSAPRQTATPANNGKKVVHLMMGEGTIVKELTRNGEAWLQIKFGKETLEFRVNDPNIRRRS